MITAVSIAISVLALLVSFVRMPRLEVIRHSAVFFALGAGNIHIAVIALSVLLFVNNGYRPPFRSLKSAEIIILLMVALIASITLFSPVTARTVAKLLHLGLFIFILFQLLQELASAERIRFYLRSMTYAATAVAALGVGLSVVGITESPHIYLGRGSNEGSAFVTFMGLIPAMTLLLWDRRPHYLLLTGVMVLANVLAGSRANTALSAVMFAGAFYFMFNSRAIKVGMLAAAIGIIYQSRDVIGFQLDRQMNYSTLERIELTRYGWELWKQRPLTGWGWGSTSNLVPQASLVTGEYPHFHNTWVQILVEVGAVGWLMISLLAAFALRCLWVSMVTLRSPVVSAYVCFAVISIVWTGFFEALTFGADRIVLLLFTLPIMGYMTTIGLKAQHQARTAQAAMRRGQTATRDDVISATEPAR